MTMTWAITEGLKTLKSAEDHGMQILWVRFFRTKTGKLAMKYRYRLLPDLLIKIPEEKVREMVEEFLNEVEKDKGTLKSGE